MTQCTPRPKLKIDNLLRSLPNFMFCTVHRRSDGGSLRYRHRPHSKPPLKTKGSKTGIDFSKRLDFSFPTLAFVHSYLWSIARQPQTTTSSGFMPAIKAVGSYRNEQSRRGAVEMATTKLAAEAHDGGDDFAGNGSPSEEAVAVGEGAPVVSSRSSSVNILLVLLCETHHANGTHASRVAQARGYCVLSKEQAK